jgi:large subunit ribosomal protein L35
MHRPIYRHLLNKKWRFRNRPILIQRLEQFNIVPDVLPKIDPIVDLQVRFRRKKAQPGSILDSLLTEEHPTFNVIPFKAGNILCTVAIVDTGMADDSKSE